MTTFHPQDSGSALDDAGQDHQLRLAIRNYIIENLLLGTAEELDDAASLMESGIIDSTGAMELVTFLEEEFAIDIADKELIPANLDSVDGIVAMVERKLAGR